MSKEKLDTELIKQIIEYPGLETLSATELMSMVRFIKAGLKAFAPEPLEVNRNIKFPPASDNRQFC